RSNNELDVSKLSSEYNIENIQTSIHKLFKRMQLNIVTTRFINAPTLISRPGWSEINAIRQNTITLQIKQNAGFYGDTDSFNEWTERYIDCLKNSTYIFIPPSQLDRNVYLNIFNRLGIQLPMYYYPNFLEYYIELFEKITQTNKCLILSSMTDTMKQNLHNIKNIFPDNDINPESFVFIKTYNTFLGVEYPHNDWYETYRHIVQKIDDVFDNEDIKYVFVSCGCYGLPLCNYIFQKYNVSTMYVGGILQLCFGIKGERWDRQGNIKKYYNKYWSRPLITEIPDIYKKIENGCYW
ncbi:MAG: hypothetical protein KC414_14025, partial [Romboutsia sp.]|nr:hypothetical protein [Romboutsia sp.]